MEFLRNRSLRTYNSFGVEVRANYFLSVGSVSDLTMAIASDSHPKLILGGGSNILFAADYEGLVIHNAIGGIEVAQKLVKTSLLR